MAMNKFAAPVLPLAPNDYDAKYMNQLVRVLNIYFSQISSTTPITVDTIALKALPTSATGLPTGSVWNNANVLNIVP
jgi:hypothetical protein